MVRVSLQVETSDDHGTVAPFQLLLRGRYLAGPPPSATAPCLGPLLRELPRSTQRAPAKLTEDGQHSAALRQLQGIFCILAWSPQLRFLRRSATGVSTLQGRSTFATKLSSLEVFRKGMICPGLVRSTATSKAAAAIERAGMKFAFSAGGLDVWFSRCCDSHRSICFLRPAVLLEALPEWEGGTSAISCCAFGSGHYEPIASIKNSTEAFVSADAFRCCRPFAWSQLGISA